MVARQKFLEKKKYFFHDASKKPEINKFKIFATTSACLLLITDPEGRKEGRKENDLVPLKKKCSETFIYTRYLLTTTFELLFHSIFPQ